MSIVKNDISANKSIFLCHQDLFVVDSPVYMAEKLKFNINQEDVETIKELKL